MTWTKLGAEFSDDCAEVDLSDAAYRTHVEAIQYLYNIKATSCRFSKRSVRRFATSENSAAAIKELLDQGWWIDLGTRYEVVHHADVVRESLEAQTAKKERDKKAQQARRDRKAKDEANAPSTPNVSADVIADTRQTDRQTSSYKGGTKTTCKHGVPNGDQLEPWSDHGLVCAACTREARGA